MDRVVGRSGVEYPLAPGSLIGQGAEGRVYRAGPSCVKVLAARPEADRADAIALLARLRRKVPGFAWPVDLVVDPANGDPVGFAMAYVPGESLESLLDARATGAIPPETKLRLALRVARSVAAAHARRGPAIVLGDVLKAGNLIISGADATFVDAGSVTLLGFRVASGEVRDCVSPLSTPGYVPKEVLDNPLAPPSEASDRFALAVLLFELLFGRPPHEVRPCPAAVGLEPDDAVRQGLCPRWVRHPEFEAPGYDPVAAPPEVDQLFRAAFLASAVRPSAAEWSAALESWLGVVARSGRRRRGRRPPRWLRRLDPVSVAVALAVALAYPAKLARDRLTAPPPAHAETDARSIPAARAIPIAHATPTVREIPPAPRKPVGPPLFRELFR